MEKRKINTTSGGERREWIYGQRRRDRGRDCNEEKDVEKE